ncbi:UNVERIFIED_CONTAM: hypothetical protein NCL1_54181 [Trichonephila clavipes]
MPAETNQYLNQTNTTVIYCANSKNTLRTIPLIRFTIKAILIKIHLGQIILQSAQYAYPYIIKLIHMEKQQHKNIIYNFPNRKRDGVKHTRSKIADEHLKWNLLFLMITR